MKNSQNFHILMPITNGADFSPLVFDSPHSGTTYPEDFQYSADFSKLRQAEDTYVDQIFDFSPSLGIPLLCANFPRSYVDVNRCVDEIDPLLLTTPWPEPFEVSSKAKLGKGLIWRLLDDGTPIYEKSLSVEEVQSRISRCWVPYHLALTELLDDFYETFGAVLHINCHSMPSVSDKYSTDSPGLVHPDIVLGDRDGTSADPSINLFLQAQFEKKGYSCWINNPYKGVELVRAYSAPLKQRHSLQLEINRRLYMNEKTLELNPGFDKIKQDIQDICRDLIVFFNKHISKTKTLSKVA